MEDFHQGFSKYIREGWKYLFYARSKHHYLHSTREEDYTKKKGGMRIKDVFYLR